MNDNQIILTPDTANQVRKEFTLTEEYLVKPKIINSISDEDMTIPLIAAGPSIPGSSTIKNEVQITDIAPTIARYFGINMPDEWIGQPIQFSTAQ